MKVEFKTQKPTLQNVCKSCALKFNFPLTIINYISALKHRTSSKYTVTVTKTNPSLNNDY